MNILILTVGDEILIGQVIDTNSAWIGQQLSEIGASIIEIKSIKDNQETIVEGIRYAFEKSDIILMTGGLGPTKDDVTKKSIADYFGVSLEFDEATYANIEKIFARFNRQVSESHRIQSYMPTNAELLFNRMGTAPGMLFRQGEKILISMPGVPYEMKCIMEDHVLPMIASTIHDSKKRYSRTIMTAGTGETIIEDSITDIVSSFENNISVAYLPSLGSVRVRITGVGNLDQVRPMVDGYALKISDRLGDIVFGMDDTSLAESVQRLCISKGLTVGTAESCTGGAVSSLITEISGSSAYYMGSIISYSNEMKINLLGVSPSTLKKYGAVSEETVVEMKNGAINSLGVDVAISISGIAGPSGGTPDKPVGTIWMCVGNKDTSHSFKIQASKDRLKNIEYASKLALNAIRKFIIKHY